MSAVGHLSDRLIGQRWRVRCQQGVYRRFGRFARRAHGRGPLLVAVGDSLTDPRCPYTLPRQVWLRIVGRQGYRTVNLGVWGETTGEMRERIQQVLCHGRPDVAVLFGGANDAIRGVDAAETERNASFIVEWLRDAGVTKIALIGPGLLNSERPADWVQAAGEVREVLQRVALRDGVVFVDLAAFQRERIASGKDPDFTRVPYRQSRSWHVSDGDPHFNAYGQRLVADAFLQATAAWGHPAAGRSRKILSRHDVRSETC